MRGVLTAALGKGSSTAPNGRIQSPPKRDAAGRRCTARSFYIRSDGGDAAARWGVSTSTAARWIASGRRGAAVPATFMLAGPATASGRYLISITTVFHCPFGRVARSSMIVGALVRRRVWSRLVHSLIPA